MTRIANQKGFIPDTATNTGHPAQAQPDIWQSLVALPAAPGPQAPMPLPNTVPAREASGVTVAYQDGMHGLPGCIQHPYAVQPMPLPKEPGETQARPHGYQHPGFEKLDLTVETERGFAYPQRLFAQGYLSEILGDAAMSPAGTVDSGTGEASTAPDGKQVMEPLPDGPAHLEGTISQWNRDAKPGPAMPLIAPSEPGDSIQDDSRIEQQQTSRGQASDISEWLRRHSTVLDRDGQLQVWVRDYRMDKREQAALIAHLEKEAMITGRRIEGITINGKPVPRGPVG